MSRSFLGKTKKNPPTIACSNNVRRSRPSCENYPAAITDRLVPAQARRLTSQIKLTPPHRWLLPFTSSLPARPAAKTAKGQNRKPLPPQQALLSASEKHRPQEADSERNHNRRQPHTLPATGSGENMMDITG